MEWNKQLREHCQGYSVFNKRKLKLILNSNLFFRFSKICLDYDCDEGIENYLAVFSIHDGLRYENDEVRE